MANILWLQSLVKIVYITSVKNNSSRFAAHGSSFVWVGRQKTNIKQGKSFFVTTNWDDCTMHIESQLHGTELTVCCTSRRFVASGYRRLSPCRSLKVLRQKVKPIKSFHLSTTNKKTDRKENLSFTPSVNCCSYCFSTSSQSLLFPSIPHEKLAPEPARATLELSAKM